MTFKVCGMAVEPEVGAAADGPLSEVLATVEAWRSRGAAAQDPVAFGVIEALARRAAAQQGPARQLLLQRVHELLARQTAALGAAVQATPPAAQAAASQAALAGLSALVDCLGRTPLAPLPAAAPARPGAVGRAELPRMAMRSPAAAPRPLKAVAAFKGTWSRLRAEQRLRQALAQVPEKAGPLNSSHVVHRALQTLHSLSPAYLDAFMLHIDTLLWLEQASGGGEAALRVPPRAEAPRRPAAPAVRKR